MNTKVKYCTIVLICFSVLLSILIGINGYIKSKQFTVCEKLEEELDLKLKEVNKQLDKGETTEIYIDNVFQANQCVLLGSYIYNADAFYSDLLGFGVTPTASKIICSKDLFQEGISLFILKGEKVVCASRIYYARLSEPLIVTNIGPKIKFVLAREADFENIEKDEDQSQENYVMPILKLKRVE